MAALRIKHKGRALSNGCPPSTSFSRPTAAISTVVGPAPGSPRVAVTATCRRAIKARPESGPFVAVVAS